MTDKEYKNQPLAICIGDSQHDDEIRYKCPVCGKDFVHWSEIHDENGHRGCPHCKTILKGTPYCRFKSDYRHY